MIRRPPRSARTDTLLPYTTRVRSTDRVGSVTKPKAPETQAFAPHCPVSAAVPEGSFSDCLRHPRHGHAPQPAPATVPVRLTLRHCRCRACPGNPFLRPLHSSRHPGQATAGRASRDPWFGQALGGPYGPRPADPARPLGGVHGGGRGGG